MEKKQEQQKMEKKPEQEEKKGNLEGLPMEDSPYVKYKDLEDYKRKGYGTEGHLQPKPGRDAGATDAPTPSGAVVSSQADVATTETINCQEVP